MKKRGKVNIIFGNTRKRANCPKYDEKTIGQLRKMFREIAMNTHATISVMLVCEFVYAEELLDFKGWLENTLYRKTLENNFIKKWLQRKCFPLNFEKRSRTTILQNMCEQTFFWLCEHLWCNKVLPYPCSIKDVVLLFWNNVCSSVFIFCR